MLVELITPLVLATAPMAVDVPTETYNHHQQVSVSFIKGELQQRVTYNGTQTFGIDGRPRDSDND